MQEIPTQYKQFGEFITDYLEHRHPFLFIDKVKEFNDKLFICELTLKENAFYLKNYLFDAIWTPEIMAQTVALRIGIDRKSKGLNLLRGYLISINKCVFNQNRDILVGEKLIINLYDEVIFDTLAHFSCELYSLHDGLNTVAHMKFILSTEEI